jgi:hypothetical protein
VGTARGTIRRWLKNGLAAIDDRRPILIRGLDLLDYLKAKAKPKQSCPPGQCYCVKCKAPKEPDGGMAEYFVLTSTSGNLRAICPTCGTLMHRRTSMVQLQQIRGALAVTIVERSPRLRDSDQPSTNDHFEGA